MFEASFIVLGGTGLIGSAVQAHLERQGESVISVNSRNYDDCVGRRARVLINSNGSSFRYRADQDPRWDFEANVITVQRSLFDFRADLYIYISTVDVYNHLDDPGRNHESYPIQPERLCAYGFHKWLAERLVERFTGRSVILRLGTVLGGGLKKGPIYDILNGRPLYMSLDSELTFIDTHSIARAISAVIATRPTRDIINLTGTGSARLRDLQAGIRCSIQLAAGAEAVTHHYNVNNEKIRGIMPIPTSLEIAEQFLSHYGDERP